jgi:hypothetical protein
MSDIGGNYAQHWFKGVWMPGRKHVKQSKIICTEVDVRVLQQVVDNRWCKASCAAQHSNDRQGHRPPETAQKLPPGSRIVFGALFN